MEEIEMGWPAYDRWPGLLKRICDSVDYPYKDKDIPTVSRLRWHKRGEHVECSGFDLVFVRFNERYSLKTGHSCRYKVDLVWSWSGDKVIDFKVTK